MYHFDYRHKNQLCYKSRRSTPTFCFRVADEIPAPLGLKLCQRSVLAEAIEQGSVLALRQQRAADGGPQRPQLDAVGGIKVLKGQAGGRMLGTGGRLFQKTTDRNYLPSMTSSTSEHRSSDLRALPDLISD